MRFDFVPFFNPGETIPWDRVVRMMREQTAIAEQADFTTVWLTEHHFAQNGYLNAPTNPILLGADLAAHAKKMRVGQAPVVLPDWHPLRVAEDVALLDNMTEGRVDFGVARGINERVCVQFNADADRRDADRNFRLFKETLEIVLKAWTEDPFTFEGEFYKFPVPGWHETNRFLHPLDERYHAPDGEYKAMYIHPRPYQDPHPPVWLMSNAPPTYTEAGERGFNVIGMSSPRDAITAAWTAYSDAASQRLGRTVPVGEGVGLCVVIYVADSMEQAAKDVRSSINSYYEFLGGSRPGGEWARASYLSKGQTPSADDLEADWFDFLMKHDLIWVGDAQYVTEKIQMYQEEIGLKHIMLLQQFPGFPYEKITASMDRLAEHVCPKFAL